MIHFNSPLTLDSTTQWIPIIALILVSALHVYLRQLIGKQSRANQLAAQVSLEGRSAKPI